MPGDISYLILTVITISCLHTIAGPDHYVPFIALSKYKSWTVTETVFWTLLCGLGHVGSSIILGVAGIAFGWSLSNIKWLENVRGGVSGWAMLLIGIVYTFYAIIQMRRDRLHKHFDLNQNGDIYVYEHKDGSLVLPKERRKVTPWIMFIVFVLGPCEPLIPLLSFPAAQRSIMGITLAITVFTIVTLVIMVTMVLLGLYGIALFKTGRLERFTNVLAGLSVLTCGAGMLLLEW